MEFIQKKALKQKIKLIFNIFKNFNKIYKNKYK
jgi:hypothetical protein